MRTQSVCVLFAVAIASLALADFTLEIGDKPNEVFFLWQGTYSTEGGQFDNLARVPALKMAYQKDLIEEIEILEVRELDTDQPLPFNYVSKGNAAAGSKLQDVVWYYPNPIPRGGRARVQIRGRMVAPKVYTGSGSMIEVKFESMEDVFVVAPVGFSLTYCNIPIIVYEKNARTVASFKASADAKAGGTNQAEAGGLICLRAKSVESLLASQQPPAIDRVPRAKVISSRIPIEVKPCEQPVVLESAYKVLEKSKPVFVASVEQGYFRESDLEKLRAGGALVWKVGDQVVVGEESFRRAVSHLVIGSKVKVYLAKIGDGNQVTSVEPVEVPVIAFTDTGTQTGAGKAAKAKDSSTDR